MAGSQKIGSKKNSGSVSANSCLGSLPCARQVRVLGSPASQPQQTSRRDAFKDRLQPPSIVAKGGFSRTTCAYLAALSSPNPLIPIAHPSRFGFSADTAMQWTNPPENDC
jgi:hypothetical protein